MKKIISFILVLASLLGCLAVLPFGVWAEELASGGTVGTLKPVKASAVVESYIKGALTGQQTQKYDSAQDKIERDENMVLMTVKNGMKLYANVYTGEVYVQNTKTGDVLYSNPYDLTGVSNANANKYMSQVILRYVLAETNKGGQDLYSFSGAAMHGQINVEDISGGVRVNYTLGETTKRYLLPYGIAATELIEILFAPMQKKIEEQLREMVSAAGMPDKYMDKYFNFVNFCNSKDGKQYSTLNSLGTEYTYGNIAAFEAWFYTATNFYDYFYQYEDYEKVEERDDPNVKRSEEWQSTRPNKENLSRIASEYNQLEVFYIFETPYLSTEGNDISKWVVNEDALKRPYLSQTGEHKVLGETYYCNAMFTIDQTLTPNKMREAEKLFSQNVELSSYTLSMALQAEETTSVHPLDSDKPVFRISLEYKLTEDGVTAEVPATSIVYDESKYKVTQIDVLPFMGTSDVREDGYIFYPDGSGTLIEYSEFRSDTNTITLDGKIYGEDYAKYVIQGMYQKNISMPVFGVVHDNNKYEIETPFGTFPCSYSEYRDQNVVITYSYNASNKTFYANLPYNRTVEVTKAKVLSGGYYIDRNLTVDNYSEIKTELRAKDYKLASETETGFFAIVEEGAALTTIITEFHGKNDFMSRLGTRFTPRIEDKYTLENEKEGDLVFTVQAKDKYRGSYSVRYIMLTDESVAEKKGITDYYKPSYVDMARAYQDYLLENGYLPESADVNDQLPLIIESFGVMQTQKKYLSIPFTVDVALTTFDDIETMYNEMSEMGIDNVKFRLTGFTNGGMSSTYPVKVKWESEAGGKRGFKDLLTYASDEERAANGLQIFPNFDFLYVKSTGSFDGINVKKIGARSADNRYAIRKAYTSIYQAYTLNTDDGILVSSNKLEELYAKFEKKYMKYGNQAISLKGLALDLSGNFDEDNGISREDSMNYITAMLDSVTASSQGMSVMSDGGNLYALKYMDYLVDAPLDSSHFKFSSRTIPFWGMVVHGHVQYAGDAFNEQANRDEALLHAIESGANLYFILSYSNTQLMKDSAILSKYYSVDYQISKGTVEEYYKKLNEAIGDLQSHKITNHSLLYAERVISDIEKIEAQYAELEQEFMDYLDAQVVAARNEARSLIIELRRVANLTTAPKITNYDTDGDGLLTGAELDTAWGVTINFQDAVVSVMKAYITNPIIRDLIGDVDLDIEDALTRDTAERAAAKAVYAALVNGTLCVDYGQTVGVAFDAEAVVAAACRMLGVDALRPAFEETLRDYIRENDANVYETDVAVRITDVTYTPAHSYFTTSSCMDANYKATESTISNGTVVMVTYSNGTEDVRIVLNYNVFDVNIQIDGVGTVTLGKYGYMRID